MLTCPCCHARFSFEAVLNDEAARKAVVAALKLPPPLGELIMRYLALFRPERRSLSWDRVSRLLNELYTDIGMGQIERRGRAWAAPMEHWRIAFEEILRQSGKLRLPLGSHGYLYEILVGLADKVEAAAEKKQEESRRSRQNGNKQAGSVIEMQSQLNSLNTLIENTDSDAVRKILKNQADKLQKDLDNPGGDS